MNHAIRVYETGGTEQLKYEEIEVPKPGPGEVLIRHDAIGINFIDVYFRSGLYPTSTPFIPGMEAAGTIEEIGDGVENFNTGERIAYASMPIGSYAHYRIISSDRLVKLPDDISSDMAAAIMLKGMTAEYLLRRTFPVQPAQTILFHAAAGGVGLIACQWAKSLGATVIGTVGSEEKAAIAKENGCDHTILYREEDIADRVMEITQGEGVQVVYDSVGRDTFESSLNSLQSRGTMVSFGNSSGPLEPFAPSLLTEKGSLFLTRPSLMDYTKDTDEYRICAQALFDIIRGGAIKISINQRYELKDAALAHRNLEERKTTGSSIFTLA